MESGTAAVVIAIAAAGVARAEPNDLVARRLVLGRHDVVASLTLELDLAQNPLDRGDSLAPDVWFGVTRRWTVGLIHSNRSIDRIDGGASICIRGANPLCDHRYHGGGLDVRWSLRDGDLAVAARSRLIVRDIDPNKPAFTLGAQARWTRGRFAITTDPYLQLGLANLDRGNRAIAIVPVWFAVQPACRWLVALHTGVDGELATWRDGWHVPVALAIELRGPYGLELGIEAGFSQLLGPQNDYKQRAIMTTATYRLEHPR